MASTGAMADYLVHMTLDAAMSDGTFTVPTNVYVMLSTTTIAAGDNATVAVEPSEDTPAWTNYDRVITTDANWDAAASRQKNYAAAVDFGTAATAGTVPITDWALVDAAGTGNSANMLWYGTTDGTINVQNGNPVSVTANNLDIKIATSLGTPA